MFRGSFSYLRISFLYLCIAWWTRSKFNFILIQYHGQPWYIWISEPGQPFQSKITVPSSMDRTSRCNKVDAVRLYASYMINLLLLKGQRCVGYTFEIINIFIPINYSKELLLPSYYLTFWNQFNLHLINN